MKWGRLCCLPGPCRYSSWASAEGHIQVYGPTTGGDLLISVAPVTIEGSAETQNVD